jgi:hypothetical protein
MQSEQGYLSQDKLALLFIREQIVGHATLNIQLLDKRFTAAIQLQLFKLEFIVYSSSYNKHLH